MININYPNSMLNKTTNEQLKVLLQADSEHEHREFKTAEAQYSYNKGTHSILGYCTAIANERGGKLILGVTDKIPRDIVGTSYYAPDYTKLERNILRDFGRKVIIEELFVEGKRILILNIPSRPIGEPMQFKGSYITRSRDELVPMTQDQLKTIYEEALNDYSSKVLPEVMLHDLDPEAIKNLRKLLVESGRTDKDISSFSDNQLLEDLNLIDGSKITIAALILLGKSSILSKYLPFAEIRYGYKEDSGEIRNQDSVIYKEAYLIYHEKIWNKINARNLTLTIPQGLWVTEKKTFGKDTIREAINNAIIHRSYAEPQSIIITHTPKGFEISSPGGLPAGVTIENMIDKSKPRNKLIADVLQKCGFVETFGHGVNLIYQKQLELGKNPPDYSKTDNYNVVLEIQGEIKHPRFTEYVYNVAKDINKLLNDEELRILYQLKDEPQNVTSRKIRALSNIGIVEKTSRGKFMLAQKYYDYMDKRGEYTRRKGLDKSTNKELLLKHINTHKRGYKQDFIDVLKDVPPKTIESYIQELKKEGNIELIGNPKITKGSNRAYWSIAKKTTL